MEIVAAGTYNFDLDVRFPRMMKNPFELPAGMTRDFESTTRRGASGEITLKFPVGKDALAKWLATNRFTDLAGRNLTVTRLELIQNGGAGGAQGPGTPRLHGLFPGRHQARELLRGVPERGVLRGG
jgi:hypothetical protein